MNLYDFDKTVYYKDCTVEFWKYCIRRKPYLLFGLPVQVLGFALYKLKIKPKEYFKSKFLFFVKHFENIEEEIERFWDKEEANVCRHFRAMLSSDDVIVSASPEFLVVPIAKRLGVRCLASPVDPESAGFTGANCKGEEKIRRLAEIGITSADKAFSDSVSDLPMLSLAKEGYVIKNLSREEYKVVKSIIVKSITATSTTP